MTRKWRPRHNSSNEFVGRSPEEPDAVWILNIETELYRCIYNKNNVHSIGRGASPEEALANAKKIVR